MGNETTAIAVTEKAVADFVRGALPNLMNYAVRAYDPDAWAKTAMLCIVDNPELLACMATSAGKASLYHALRYAATTGLSLNPQEGKAALVPIQGKVHYWIEKGGMIDLVMETGAVKLIRANSVRSGDKFRLTETLDGDSYEFSPSPRNRGEIIGFFCAIRLRDGGSLVHWMSREEVEAHRDAYGKGLAKTDSAWRKSFEGMGIKTVIKMALRRIALPKEAERVIGAAEEAEAQEEEAIPGSFEQMPGSGAVELERKLEEKQAQMAEAPQAASPSAEASPTAQRDKGELDIF